MRIIVKFFTSQQINITWGFEKFLFMHHWTKCFFAAPRLLSSLFLQQTLINCSANCSGRSLDTWQEWQQHWVYFETVALKKKRFYVKDSCKEKNSNLKFVRSSWKERFEFFGLQFGPGSCESGWLWLGRPCSKNAHCLWGSFPSFHSPWELPKREEIFRWLTVVNHQGETSSLQWC